MASIDVRGTGGASSIDLLASALSADPRMPTGALAQTYDRVGAYTVSSGGAITASGTLHLTPIILRAGITVTNISMVSGTVAAVTPTAWWYALYDSSLNLLKQTADQTTTAFGANTTKTLALSSTQAITTSGRYFIGFMMAAATVVYHTGIANSSGNALGPTPIPCGTTTDTGLTTTAPNPCAAINGTFNAIVPYAWVT